MNAKQVLSLFVSVLVTAVAGTAGAASDAEVLAFFDREIYGAVPPKAASVTFDLVETGPAFDGTAVRRQYVITSRDVCGKHRFEVLVYLPTGAFHRNAPTSGPTGVSHVAAPRRPIPAVCYQNFQGNQTLTDDSAVRVCPCREYWEEASTFPRASCASRAGVRDVLARGFAYASWCYCELYPDTSDTQTSRADRSVWAIFPPEKRDQELTHGAWAYGASRVMDLLETFPEIDATRVALVGQSRLAKNALIAAAHDRRFALAVACCGGTKRLNYLPTLKFPHFFSPRMRAYAEIATTGDSLEKLAELADGRPKPRFDQPDFIATLADRAVYISCADGDPWASAKATYDCVRAIAPAFAARGGELGFHETHGPHAITPADWKRYLDFMEMRLGWDGAFAAATPQANPADQMRFFWQFNPVVVSNLVAMGYNTLYHNEPVEPEWLASNGVDYVFLLGAMNCPRFCRTYPRFTRDGQKDENAADATDARYLAENRAVAARRAAQSAALACCTGVQPSSEELIRAAPSFTPAHAEAFRKATGLDVPDLARGRVAPSWKEIPDFPADRALDEDWPLLAFYRWFWEEDNFAAAIGEYVSAFRTAMGRTPFSVHDPELRVPPLWASAPSLSHLCEWAPTYPEPYRAAYVAAQLKAMARRVPGQRVTVLLQGIAARFETSPQEFETEGPVPAWATRVNPKRQFVSTAPDLYREAVWAALSRRTDGIGTHGWNALFDGSGVVSNTFTTSYVFTNPDLAPAISNVMQTVARPLGPLVRAARERAPRVAVLESYPSALFGGKPAWNWATPAWEWGCLAVAANLDPYALYEEEIAAYGIPETVSVILAPKCEVVTKTTARALARFRARGGRILADEAFAPAVTADAPLPKLLRRIQKSVVSDPDWERKYAEKRSAAARELAAACALTVPAYVSCDTPDILVNARCAGAADLVFAINDRRVFGDYFGPWRLMREKGAPNRGTVTVARRAGAVYDLVRRCPVAFETTDGETRISVAYETNEGRALLVAPRPLAPLAARREGTDVVITSPDRDVLVPAGLRTENGTWIYGIVVNGCWRIAVPAGAVRVVNLTTGEEKEF